MRFNACKLTGAHKPDLMVTYEEWRDIAYVLWQLLDNIDTASDMFKPQKNGFYDYVMERVAERFEHIESDGAKLFVVDQKEKRKRNQIENKSW